MNWKELNQAYPMAFLEVAKYYGASPNATNIVPAISENEFLYDIVSRIRTQKIIKFDNHADVLQLPEYFDALGVHVDTYQVDEAAKALREFAGLDTEHGYSVTVKSPNVWEGATYTTRREALEAGIIKAFEIREEQIK